VMRNNESALAEAQAMKDNADNAYAKEKERFERYTAQKAKCTIRAPQDGMVAYATEEGRWNRSAVIEEGAFVRERQEILSIPDLTRMQVNMAVHESVLDQVSAGLRATVRVDAFSDRIYNGTVASVAVLPDQGGWLSSDTKVYKTIVTIDEEVTQLKPGMTAVVEIDIEQLENVLTVPIQAIVQRADKNWCYLQIAGRPERREVTLGKTNDKFVAIQEGLAEGDIVVLNPMSLVQEQQAAAAVKKAAAKKSAQDTPDADDAESTATEANAAAGTVEASDTDADADTGESTAAAPATAAPDRQRPAPEGAPKRAPRKPPTVAPSTPSTGTNSPQ